MTDEELLKITDSMQEKLGDNAGVIADDIGLLITGNSNSQKALVAKDEEIKRLKSLYHLKGIRKSRSQRKST